MTPEAQAAPAPYPRYRVTARRTEDWEQLAITGPLSREVLLDRLEGGSSELIRRDADHELSRNDTSRTICKLFRASDAERLISDHYNSMRMDPWEPGWEEALLDSITESAVEILIDGPCDSPAYYFEALAWMALSETAREDMAHEARGAAQDAERHER